MRTALTEALFLTNCGAPGAEAEDARVIKRLRPGDVLVVTRLDRLARSTRDLLNFLEADKRGHVLPDGCCWNGSAHSPGFCWNDFWHHGPRHLTTPPLHITGSRSRALTMSTGEF